MKTKLIQAMSRLIAILLIVILTSCEEDKLESVSRVTVSQGTYVGIIHLDWPPVSDAGHYNIERMGPDGQWIGAGTVNQPPFDDYGFGLPDNKLVEGNRYVYRIISGSDDLEDSPYSDISDEGWIYQFQPIDFKAIRQDDGKVLLSWTDTNQTLINQSNLESCRYRIQRRYENETSFTDIKTTDVTTNVANSYLDNSVSQDKKAFYKIEGFYTYRYKNMDYGMYTNTYSKKYDEVKESGGITQVDYNITQLGDFPNANDGYGFVLLKNINNTIYAATIPKPVFGSPIIYELNGTSWQNISSSYPSGLQQNFDKISIGGDGTNLWVGGVSDSAYIYSYQSGWSDNLAKNNLGLNGKPDNVLIEYSQDNLYALCYHDNTLEVFAYTQNGLWNSNGILENSGNGILNMGFKDFNGTLFAYYLVINSQTNSTLKIKHLSGSSWQTDFEAAYDNINNVKICVDNAGAIYFSNDGQSSSSSGNVYRVTSLSTAQELIGASNTWLTFPNNLDFDDLGNLVVLYAKYNAQSNGFEMRLAVYKNNEWMDVTGDFSSSISPADIESNSGLYFVSGDGNNVVNSYPVILKAIKLTN